MSKKDKGKLGQLIKAIHGADPLKDKYVVANVEFYDGGSKHFTITPFNKEKIIEHLRELSKGKEVKGEVYVPDAVGVTLFLVSALNLSNWFLKTLLTKKKKTNTQRTQQNKSEKSVRAHSSHMFI